MYTTTTCRLRCLLSIISATIIIYFSSCAGNNEKKETSSTQPNTTKLTHAKEERLNGQVQSVIKSSYGKAVKDENGWIKGNLVIKKTMMFGENGNIDMITEEYYGDSQDLIGKLLTTYQYDENNNHTGASIMSLTNDMITQTVEWQDGNKTITTYKGDDVSNVDNIIEIEVYSFNTDGSLSAKVVEHGPNDVTLYGYKYDGDITIITAQDKVNNTEVKIYRTVLEKDKHNNPLIVATSTQSFDGRAATSYDEYEYVYWNE